ncbi:MAG TPA: NAD(P)-dependent oxidoreductase [Thermomicrobiales bacterium]|nr:NAD(P)-dependent oxidoreductase [Thermomicrobiales bacterium]
MNETLAGIYLLDEAAAGLRDELDRRLADAAGRLRVGRPEFPSGAVMVGAAMPADDVTLRAATGIVLVAPGLAEQDRVQRALAGDDSTWLAVVPDPAAEIGAQRALGLLLALAEPRGGLSGATVGFVGFQPLGWKLADILSALGASPAYWSPASERRLTEEARKQALRTGARELEFDELLRSSDAVVIDLPDTPESEPLIGRAELALMRDDALLINTTSATAIDDGALIQALRGDYLAGVALARTNLEPLPLDSPLWDIERVLLRPDAATVDPDLARRHLAAGVARTLAQRPELHLELRRVRRVARRRSPRANRGSVQSKGRD